MKKKILAILLTATIMLLVTACRASLNENNVRTAKSIINTVDSYLDGDMDAETAHDKIEKEYYSIDDNDDNEMECLSFSTDTLFISTELSSMAYDGSGDVAKIKDYRNEIAQLIGEKKYR